MFILCEMLLRFCFLVFFVVVFLKTSMSTSIKVEVLAVFWCGAFRCMLTQSHTLPQQIHPKVRQCNAQWHCNKNKKQTNKTGATSQTLQGSVQMLKSMTIRTVRKRLITMGCLEGLTGRSTFSLKKHGSTAYSIPSYWKLESCSHWFKYEPLCIPKCSRAKCEAICPTQSLAIICLFLIKKKNVTVVK